MRTVYVVDESVLGSDYNEGVLGLRRFVRMLQDLLDEEGLPIDIRIGVTSNNKLRNGIKELGNHIPDWIMKEAKEQYFEDLPG